MQKIIFYFLALSLLPGCAYPCLYPNRTVLPKYEFDNGYQLCDGLYFSVQTFRSGIPDMATGKIENIASVKKELLSVKEGRAAQINTITCNGENIFDQVWSITIDGIPFIRYEEAFYPVTSLGRLSSFFIVNAGNRVIVEERGLGPVRVEKRHRGALVLNTHNANDVTETNVGHKRTFRATVHYLIDMDSGEVEVMDSSTLMEAIKDDAVLLNEFRQRADQDQVFYSYFLRYNQRNPLELYAGLCGQ